MQIEGYAEFKSHVLRRDEKGLFGIPFKRLLFSGLGGGMVTTIAKIPFPDLSIPLGIVSFILLLFLSAPRGGILRGQLLFFGLYWKLLSAAVFAPKTLLGSLGQAFQMPIGGIDIDSDTVFTADDPAPRTALTDWISFTRYDANDAMEGLVFKANPDLNLAE